MMVSKLADKLALMMAVSMAYERVLMKDDVMASR